MTDTVYATIQRCAACYKAEMGITPNRVRMEPSTYAELVSEMQRSCLDMSKQLAKIVVVQGLRVEVPDKPPSILCEAGYIVVDYKGDDEEEAT